jgi:hydroxylamine reductase
MFCFQCEQTARTDTGAGCATAKGVCGKDAPTSDLQDLLIYQLKGLGQYAHLLHLRGEPDTAADSFILYALFTTLTNVNFNRARFQEMIAEAARIRDRLEAAIGTRLAGPASFQPADSLPGLLAQASIASVRAGLDAVGEDVVGLRALVLYGLKGVAAYAHHAEVLGQVREGIGAGIAQALSFLAAEPVDIEAILGSGPINLLPRRAVV